MRNIEYSAGLVTLEGKNEQCSPGAILEATTPAGILELVILRVEAAETHAYARDPDLLALFQVGNQLEAGIRESEPSSEPPPDVLRLLEQLESFGARIGGLIEQSTPEPPPAPIALPARDRDRWRGDIGIRFGYQRFSRAEPVIRDLDTSDRQSVERALFDLEELIRRARKVPGIDQSDLDRAEEYAREARAILRDPDGDLEQAAANIIAGQIIVEVAVERAGRDPDSIRVEEFKDEVEDSFEGYAFMNLRRSLPWSEEGELFLDEHLEGGSRFLAQDFRVRAERELLPPVRMRFESDSGLRLYREDFADDVFKHGLDLEIETSLTRRLELGLGGEYFHRREFDTSSDDGFQSGIPRVGVGYRLDRLGKIEANFEREWRAYNASANSDLDYEQDAAGITYGYFGAHGILDVFWEHTERDSDRPLDEDDYTEDEFSAYFSRTWTRRLSTGIEGRIVEREYVTTGPVDPSTGGKRGEDNTDFLAWSLRPFLETRWSLYLSTTLDYEYVRLENVDRVPEDGIDKSLGDYDLHRVGFSVQWTPADRWEIFLRQEWESRNYPNGETGEFQTWFADFRNLADYDALALSALVVHHLTSRLDTELDLFHTRERYPTFTELDNDQTTIQVVLRYLF